MAERVVPPRIYRVTYRATRLRDERGRFRVRTVTAWVKVPYGGLFGLGEVLNRALSTREIEGYTIRAARAGEITGEVRSRLTRWSVALENGNATVPVEWTA